MYIKRHELAEPDWRRFPGWAGVSAADWESAQWQRAHCVKNARQLRQVTGPGLDERFFADLERDQRERATMSMLIPPQMLNTIVSSAAPDEPGFTEAFYADPVRRYMIPAFSDRRADWPSHPYAQRDSLHEAEMWAVEGLTHRYPTKVLAELLPTCPQYCGHCTRMDLVGNPTAQTDKHKFAMAREDRLGAMLDYLRRTPGVRDVVVSGGDVANLPWPRLESFVAALLEIDSVRDIRLASKALMGLPQHWLSDEVRAGMARLAGTARSRGVSIAIHTHVNAAQSVTPLVARATAAMLEAGVRDVRNQGVLLRGVNNSNEAMLDLCFALLDGAGDHALLLLHVRHDPRQRALAAVAGRGPVAAARHHGLPARVRHPAGGLRRALRRQALGAPGGQVRHRARHLVLDEELPHRHRGRRRARAQPRVPVLRPDLPAARVRPGLVAVPVRAAASRHRHAAHDRW